MNFNEIDATIEEEQALCIRCGMCCDGSLFAWVKLRPAEIEPACAAGLLVYGKHPADRGFAQPCSAFKGVCSIYHSGFYPKGCQAYRCLFLKKYANSGLALAEAITILTEAQRFADDLRESLAALAKDSVGSKSTGVRNLITELDARMLEKDTNLLEKVQNHLRTARDLFGVTGIRDELLEDEPRSSAN